MYIVYVAHRIHSTRNILPRKVHGNATEVREHVVVRVLIDEGDDACVDGCVPRASLGRLTSLAYLSQDDRGQVTLALQHIYEAPEIYVVTYYVGGERGMRTLSRVVGAW